MIAFPKEAFKQPCPVWMFGGMWYSPPCCLSLLFPDADRLGVVHMMGVFLEPVMRPLFNVPGTGSFVMAMGLASGFPIGAILTAELRSRNPV